MFNRPNKNDPAAVVADFIELQCLLTKAPVSVYSLRSLFSISDDEMNNDGIESSDDFSVETIEDGIKECGQRALNCPEKYPFMVGPNSIEFRPDASIYKDIYQFLLLSTRLDMNADSHLGGQDATGLFEELCAKVAKEYFGQHSESMVFGTAESGGFQQKVESVISRLHLTSVYKVPLGSTGRQKDAAVDVIVWLPFNDNKDSQMIAIGQCKTGTHWERMLTATQPGVFFNAYFSNIPYADVGRLFFVSECYGLDRWEERSRKAGIMFDRTRIMEYLPCHLDENLLSGIKEWNSEAIISAGRQIQYY